MEREEGEETEEESILGARKAIMSKVYSPSSLGYLIPVFFIIFYFMIFNYNLEKNKVIIMLID